MTKKISFLHFRTALLLIITGLTSCSSDSKRVVVEAETLHGIPLVTAQERKVPDTFEAVGTVRARQTAQMASEVTGYVLSINVREGDVVKQGQVLATIDDRQLSAGVTQSQAALAVAGQEVTAAESDLSLARSTLGRYQTLYDKKSLSPQEYDEVKAGFQAAAARRDMAHSNQAQAAAVLKQSQVVLDRSRLRAPFAGAIVARQADPGALATPGMTLLTLEDGRQYRLEVNVDEQDMKYVRLQQSVPVSIDAIGSQLLEGKVVQIVPAADPASRSFLVKVELPANAGLRSGFFGRAHFSRGERNSLTVPETAILERGQLREVYVVGDSKLASVRYVTLGGRIQDQVEVLSGLSAGETLVAAPGDRELGGKRIEVR